MTQRIIVETCGGQSEVRSGDLFIRKLRFDRQGDAVGGHTHDFHHTTFVIRGRVACRTIAPDGTEAEYELGPGTHFWIDKDVLHDLVALDEGGAEVWCVYAGGATK